MTPDQDLRAEMRKVQTGDLSTLHRLVRLLQAADPIEVDDAVCDHVWSDPDEVLTARTMLRFRFCHRCPAVQFQHPWQGWPL